MVQQSASGALHESEDKFRQLFNQMPNAVAIYDAVDSGEDFIFKDFNTAAEKIEGIKKVDIIGKRVTEVFPGVKDFGIFAVFQQVWRTGQPEFFPQALYRDEHTPGTWRENWVFKLASGEVVAIYRDITEQKRAEEELENSERTFKALAGNASDGILVAVTEDANIYVNKRAGEILGYRVAELEKRGIKDIAAPEEANTMRERFRKRLLGEDVPQQYETWLIHKEGKRVPVEISASKTTWHGQLADLIIIHDMTERKAAEDALRKSEEKYRLLSETSPDHVIIQDLDLRYVYVLNPQLGLKREDMIGRNDYDFLKKEDADKLTQAKREVIRTGTATKYETSLMSKNGKNEFFEGTFVPKINKDGRIEGLTGYFRNVTERKAMVEALRKSEERLQLTVDATTDGLWDWDLPSGNALFSPRWYTMLGYKDGEMPANYATFAALVHPDDLGPAESKIQDHVQKKTKGYAIELRMRTKTGDWKWILTRGRVVERTADGEPVRMVGTHTDITERKMMEEEIRSLNKVLEQRVEQRTAQLTISLKEKEVLVREVHHRVKNNLQIITSLLNLQSRYIEDEKSAQVIKESQTRIRAMALVHEKLYQSADIAKINFDDYVRFLGNHLFQFYGMKGKGIVFTTTIPEVNLGINTAIPIGLILNELISNSLKYAFPEGRNGEISVAIQRRDDVLTVLYKDNGAGIPQDFDWRNAKSLGLRLVITLVEQLQGTIQLDRTAGTAFTIVVKEKE